MMMVNSSHVFNISWGSKTYQVIDNEESTIRDVHRYTVLVWERKGFPGGAKLLASDVEIYATSKFAAIKRFREKMKRAE